MDNDFPPSKYFSINPRTDIPISEILRRPDSNAQPDPEDVTALTAGVPPSISDLSKILWPADGLSADYAFIEHSFDMDEFCLTSNALETLIQQNSFIPYRDSGVLVFVLRGAQLVNSYEVENTHTVAIKNIRPDHRTLSCLVGFYFYSTKEISVYSGSSVPCRRAVYDYVHSNIRCNMLPTGLYPYYVWRHRDLYPALRLSKGNLNSASLEEGAITTVLRNRNDYQLDSTDIFHRSIPHDNIHCTYYLQDNPKLGASFSSWGCITVRGTKVPSDQWDKFSRVLSQIGERNRIDVMLLTGKEAALSTDPSAQSELRALRPGSQGNSVYALQTKLGLEPTGYFGSLTADRFTAIQRDINENASRGRVADGIYSNMFNNISGWNLFETIVT